MLIAVKKYLMRTTILLMASIIVIAMSIQTHAASVQKKTSEIAQDSDFIEVEEGTGTQGGNDSGGGAAGKFPILNGEVACRTAAQSQGGFGQLLGSYPVGSMFGQKEFKLKIKAIPVHYDGKWLKAHSHSFIKVVMLKTRNGPVLSPNEMHQRILEGGYVEPRGKFADIIVNQGAELVIVVKPNESLALKDEGLRTLSMNACVHITKEVCPETGCYPKK